MRSWLNFGLDSFAMCHIDQLVYSALKWSREGIATSCKLKKFWKKIALFCFIFRTLVRLCVNSDHESITSIKIYWYNKAGLLCTFNFSLIFYKFVVIVDTILGILLMLYFHHLILWLFYGKKL
jgi:hypothetical protein